MERRAFLKALGIGLATLAARPVIELLPAQAIAPAIDWQQWNQIELKVHASKPLTVWVNGMLVEHPDVIKEIKDFVHILSNGIRFGDPNNGLTLQLPLHMGDEHLVGFSMLRQGRMTGVQGARMVDDIYALRSSWTAKLVNV